MKKLLIILLLLLISATCVCAEGEDRIMYYAAIYDKNLDHVTNVKDVKFSLTRRVFDFDTSNFEGTSDVNIENGFVFVLCNNKGAAIYSGFMKNIKQIDSHVSFKGDDLKKMFDTEIILDYTKPTVNDYSYYLFDIFRSVGEEVQSQQDNINLTINYPQHESDNPSEWISTTWMANYAYQYLIVNANSFLKPYLSYYGYFINIVFNSNLKSFIVDFRKSISPKSIKLKDFTYQKTTTDVAVNKTIALQKYNVVEQTTKAWIPSDVNYWNMMPTTMRMQSNGINSVPEDSVGSASNYEMGYALKLDVIHEGTGQYWYTDYYQVGNAAVVRPPNLKQKTYYLGTDNQIYEISAIPDDKIIYPVKTKIFENEFFNKAQYDAITELVNSRYNENIIITAGMAAPIDIRDFYLYDMITVYGNDGTSVTMPVSEIEMSNDSYSIKLGFKKTLFTEVIKR